MRISQTILLLFGALMVLQVAVSVEAIRLNADGGALGPDEFETRSSAWSKSVWSSKVSRIGRHFQKKVVCPLGAETCGRTCADIMTDDNNCGACGTTCEADSSCCSGVCKNLMTDGEHCSACGIYCGGSCNGGLCNYVAP